MAKVVVIDHYKEYADMMATPLVQAGHAVVTILPPIHFERILQVQPDVITVALYRNKDAFNRPLRDAARDVTGVEVLTALEGYPALSVLPVIVLAIGLVEKDVPTTLRYDEFLTLPDDLPRLHALVEGLSQRPPGRHRISAYCCPVCRGRLVTTAAHGHELVCPRCDTVVVLEEGEKALYMTRNAPGESFTVPLSELKPPPPEAGDFPNS